MFPRDQGKKSYYQKKKEFKKLLALYCRISTTCHESHVVSFVPSFVSISSYCSSIEELIIKYEKFQNMESHRTTCVEIFKIINLRLLFMKDIIK